LQIHTSHQRVNRTSADSAVDALDGGSSCQLGKMNATLAL